MYVRPGSRKRNRASFPDFVLAFFFVKSTFRNKAKKRLQSRGLLSYYETWFFWLFTIVRSFPLRSAKLSIIKTRGEIFKSIKTINDILVPLWAKMLTFLCSQVGRPPTEKFLTSFLICRNYLTNGFYSYTPAPGYTGRCTGPSRPTTIENNRNNDQTMIKQWPNNDHKMIETLI